MDNSPENSKVPTAAPPCEPMHERELREHTECLCCQRKLGATGIPVFFKVRAEEHGLDAEAISRQTGFAQALGGNALLAYHMGPDEPMTVPLSLRMVVICHECMVERVPEMI